MPIRDVAIRDSLAWCLPDGVNVKDCLVIGRSFDIDAARGAKSLLMLGPPGRDLDAPAELTGLKVSHEFRCFPTFGYPRALLASSELRTHFKNIIEPRSSDAPLWKRAMAAAARSTPWTLRYLTSSVRLMVPAESKQFQVLVQKFQTASFGAVIAHQNSPGRTAIKAIGAGGRTIGVAKFVAQEDGRDGHGVYRLANEYDMLRTLQSIPELKSSVPAPLDLVPGHIGNMLVTNAFQGDPSPVQLTSMLRAWLDLCKSSVTIEFANTAIIRDLAKTIADEPLDSLFRSAFHHALHLVGSTMVPRTVVHGDFVPWNIIIVQGRVCVFDWEYGYADGVPGWDEAFFFIRMAYIHRGTNSYQLVAEIEHFAHHVPAPYTSRSYRAVIVFVMLHLILRDRWEGQEDRVVPVVDALAELLSNGWID